MTTTEKLIQTVAKITGQDDAEARIAQAASVLNLAPFCSTHPSGECTERGDVWYGEDADEIVERITAGVDDDADLYA